MVVESYVAHYFILITVISELFQNQLISEDDLRLLFDSYVMEYNSSRHWLGPLVHIQCTKSARVRARTFDVLRSYPLTDVVKERPTKPTGVTIHALF